MLRKAATLCLVLALIAALPAQGPPQTPPHHGLKLLDRASYQAITRALVPLGGGALPPSMDLSAGMPPVGNQGSEDSCTAWSAAYAVRTYLERLEQAWDVRSPANQFSPSFLYNQLVRGNCTEGVYMTKVLDLLTSQGAATLAAMPYSDGACTAQPNSQILQQAASYRIGGYRRLNEKDPAEIKAQLAARYPVLISIPLDETFAHLGRNQVWMTHGNTTAYHAVALVGYDDSKRIFKLMNSWGTGWGTDGYGFISYDLFPHVVQEAYLVSPFHGHDPNAQTPRAANVNIVGMSGVAGQNPGLNSQIQYTLRGYAGHTGQIALHFFYTNGTELPASNASYADINGFAATATQVFSIQQNDYENMTYQQFVPSSTFSIAAVGTELLVRADLFVDNFGVAQSGTYPFFFGSSGSSQQTQPATGVVGMVNPKWSNGYSVDWCLHWGAACGKLAADYYCQAYKYPGSASFQTAYMQPTWVMGDGKACGQGCAGFTEIVCATGGGRR